MRNQTLLASMALIATCAAKAQDTGTRAAAPPPSVKTLQDARAGFRTHLSSAEVGDGPLETPPAATFTLVDYPSPCGPMRAYLSLPSAASRSKLPAVVWLTGGFPPARGGRYVWTEGPPENDQSAAAYRREGVVLMVPTVRGTADNPGVQEANFGEVDDVIAAARHLRGVDGVDPDRVYLAGHSTGGTLALLVAESTDLFRGVVAFGPVARITDYGGRNWPFDVEDPDEVRLRSPLHWLAAIRCPTWIVEGEGGNVEDLVALREANRNPLVECILLEGEDHFTPLSPINQLLARHLAADDSAPLPATNRVPRAVRDFHRYQREARDLRLMAELRAQGIEAGASCMLEFTCELRNETRRAQVEAAFAGFEPGTVTEQVDADGDTSLLFRWRRSVAQTQADVFAAASAFRAACRGAHVRDLGWALVR